MTQYNNTPLELTFDEIRKTITKEEFESMVRSGQIAVREQQSTRVLTIAEVIATKTHANKRRVIVNQLKKVIQSRFEKQMEVLNNKVQYDNSYKSWTYTEDVDRLVKDTQAKLDKLKVGGKYYPQEEHKCSFIGITSGYTGLNNDGTSNPFEPVFQCKCGKTQTIN